MAMVSLNNVSKSYRKDQPVVQNCNLEIQKSEFMVLVGPSGCGKSTTLRMIAGLEEISEGEIYIENRKINDLAPKDRDIAMVFQNYALYPHMTAAENMAFGLKMRKFPKTEIEQRVANAAAILSLEQYLNRYPRELSGGQRQRVAVGRAIVRQPKVFLFDEPLSNLDAKLRTQMRIELKKLHQRLQSTVIYVTHDQTEAMTMGDRITVMKDGIIQQTDTPAVLYHQPHNLFTAGFIGSPGMNFIPGRIDGGAEPFFQAADRPQMRFPLSPTNPNNANLPQGSIVLGIRGEDITLCDSDSSITGTVEVVEPMGHESFLYIDAGLKQNILCRWTGPFVPRLGETVALKFNERHIHFFNTTDERRLPY